LRRHRRGSRFCGQNGREREGDGEGGGGGGTFNLCSTVIIFHHEIDHKNTLDGNTGAVTRSRIFSQPFSPRKWVRIDENWQRCAASRHRPPVAPHRSHPATRPLEWVGASASRPIRPIIAPIGNRRCGNAASPCHSPRWPAIGCRRPQRPAALSLVADSHPPFCQSPVWLMAAR